MSEHYGLRLSLVSRAAAGYRSCWVRLEQIMPDEAKQLASVTDVYNLWLAAATGKSAVRLRPDNCPVEFDGSVTRAYLGVYIWPSRPNLQYVLTVALGRLGTTRLVRMERSFSAIIDNADRYALPYFMESVSVTWETPPHTPGSELLTPDPPYRLVDGIWLVWERPVFGCIRVKGRAIGAAVVLEMEFERAVTSRPLREDEEQRWHTGPNGELILTPTPESTLDSHRIEDLKNYVTVQAACGGDLIEGKDVEQTSITTEVHEVVIPECVKKALSLCPGEMDLESFFCEQLADERVYYNACNGKILGTRQGDNGATYCSKVVTAPASGQSWLPKGGV